MVDHGDAGRRKWRAVIVMTSVAVVAVILLTFEGRYVAGVGRLFCHRRGDHRR